MTNQKNLSCGAGRFDISTAGLHILAMTLMLMDHLWATLLPAQEWLTCAGRLAYPIFAFMAVEGYFHTRSFRKYALRMLVFAVLSEVPFNLMCGGTWFYPVHQNVIWTLLMGLLGVHLLETVRRKQKPALFAAAAVGVILAGAVLITALFCRVVLFLFRYSLAGVAGATPVLLRYDLPHAVYSAVLAVPLYYPVRALHRMAEQRTDTRL